MAMRGTVAAEGNEALLGVEVLSQAGSSSLRVEAVVDTGFTGHLTLPRATVDALGLPIIGSAESILADGSLVMEDVCLARVLWHGAERPVRVLVADATPLLGMALMRGSDLRVECVGGGEVSVERLEEPSD
ncbi:MAG TPA: hypothetical protein VFQ10_07365 [Rubrobacter sp.]|nr:hypothetical protein [Rubrobacter sp.]